MVKWMWMYTNIKYWLWRRIAGIPLLCSVHELISICVCVCLVIVCAECSWCVFIFHYLWWYSFRSSRHDPHFCLSPGPNSCVVSSFRPFFLPSFLPVYSYVIHVYSIWPCVLMVFLSLFVLQRMAHFFINWWQRDCDCEDLGGLRASHGESSALRVAAPDRQALWPHRQCEP